jgi:hypothetical protein
MTSVRLLSAIGLVWGVRKPPPAKLAKSTSGKRN